MRLLLAALFLAVCMHDAHAIDAAPAFDDPALQARYERLTHELRCLQCRSETIADSNASLAADLRRQTRELIAAGKSDAEILQFMQDRYGDYVLYSPPLAPRTWLLWAAPIALLAGGMAAAVVVIARKSRLPDTDPNDPGLGGS
ncbi:MAG TPA: cytochrome c-type biogenesis protein [Steroidobacter sp.]|jgi:cytochrome c-type biogenesis protein CcmH|nr:cytochrome c-type biogenesis protein CcmH [Steroidobacteraceae bacterium]HLS82073.1 cytochrome c-type biogenesis protein [Steroidobacter sp.]